MKITLFLSLFLLILATSCDQTKDLTTSRKKELKEKFFIPNFLMPDSAIAYQLYSDSLVLKFVSPAHYENWAMEVYLFDLTGHNGVYLGNFDPQPIVNDKIVIRDFHISPDSVNLYAPELSACPYNENGIVAFKVFKDFTVNRRDFYKKHGDQNVLIPWGPETKWKRIAFNLDFLNTLKGKEYDYCIKILKEETGLDTLVETPIGNK